MRKRIHWNLHKGGLVVRNARNRVGDMEYPNVACLTDVTFVINHQARLRIRAGEARSVHAWIEGELCNCHKAIGSTAVRYNAKRDAGFVTADGALLTGAKHVLVRAIGQGKKAGYEVIADGAH